MKFSLFFSIGVLFTLNAQYGSNKRLNTVATIICEGIDNNSIGIEDINNLQVNDFSKEQLEESDQVYFEEVFKEIQWI
ncbi:hypothetical protein [Kordia sp.]|uniref:hypothetical protein n=1 Tax=Kordia sp. TaxID=1965332 RepID=UPI003D2CE083